MKNIIRTLIALIAIGIVYLYASAVIISEGEAGILLSDGKVEMVQNKPIVLSPGLHWITPFKQAIKIYDVHLQSYVSQDLKLDTSDGQSLTVDIWTEWKIQDPVQYYQATEGHNEKWINALQQALTTELKAQIAQQSISAWIAKPVILENGLNSINAVLNPYGIVVKAVGINSVTLPAQVVKNVHANMQEHLTTLLATVNAEAKERVELIHVEANAKASVILAAANSQVSKLKAEGDAKAADIYNTAYQAAPKFYMFFRSMQAYQAVFTNSHVVLVLRPQGDFFKYFTSLAGVQTPNP